MTHMSWIGLGDMARSRGKTSAPKPPPEYGALLQRHREALGLTREQMAKLANLDANTVRRNEIGDELRSVKGANAIREALVAHGRDVPPVPVGGGPWAPHVVVVPSTPKLDPADEVVRRNLIRFREALGLDQFAASFAIGIPFAELQAYELGEHVPATPMIARIAEAYGCSRGAFLDDAPALPSFAPSPRVAFHYGGPNTRYLTDEQRRTLAEIAESAARAAAADRPGDPKKPGPKRR